MPALKKRYLGEFNCISGGLKSCTNCTQKGVSKKRITPVIGVQKELFLFLLLTTLNAPSYLTSTPSVPHPGEGEILSSQLLTSPGSGPTLPRRKPLSKLIVQGDKFIQETSGTAALMKF